VVGRAVHSIQEGLVASAITSVVAVGVDQHRAVGLGNVQVAAA
jgi:hypothetical protein